MLYKPLVASLFGASSVLADGAAITAAIATIQNATLDLTATVASWNGDLLGAIPIVTHSASVLHTINEATGTAKESATLSNPEAISVGGGIISLGTVVNASLATIVAAKPKFDESLLTGVVLLNLNLEKAASAGFSKAVIDKLPATFVTTAQTLAGQITASFNQAIDVFDGPF
ncbi:unnamed protein product [Discula destructiva]